MIIITNLCIGITYLFSIILIIDELYNIGFFTFKYTYQYNYGSFISKFNNVQTIECETNRFNVYNNINFIFKDIYNKSYFNYLLIIVATLITVLCCIAYAVYFYFKFIIEQPLECSFDEDINLSFPKQLLKCLCDECHKLIPNCTSNYFIVFILLIIIPLSYIFKTIFNINFTPNTDNALFGFIYICVFILLIFYYSFNLFNRKTEYKYKDLIVYSLFTLIFISSGYIYKYIYSKYNNINLNSSNNISTIYDIYKQTPPIKPTPIQKPIYKGKDLISDFKYNNGDKDPDYKIKKTIVDDYYKSIKTYDNDMKHYNDRYNAYTNSLSYSKLGDKTNYFDIAIHILGLNNYMHIYLIILIIISLVIYNIYYDDISYVCFIYLLTMLITLTVMNSILYYNTYVNKYIIYEPMAHYKNDITNANTALNLELNPSSGVVFYNKLINNDKLLITEPNSDVKNGKEILEDIKKLKDIKYYTFDNTSNINNVIAKYNTFGLNLATSLTVDNTQINNAVFLYKKVAGASAAITPFASADDPILYLIENCISYINSTSGNIKIEPIKKFTFKYSKIDIKLEINMTNYYRYFYYKAHQYKLILEKITGELKNANLITINNLKDIINRIISLLAPYKENNVTNNTYMINSDINTNINQLTISFDDAFLTKLKNKINEINDNIIKHIDIAKLNLSITANQKIPFITATLDDGAQFINEIARTHYVYSNALNKYKITNTNIKDIQILTETTNYFELPIKIIDDNDEYYLKLIASKIMVFIKYNIQLPDIHTNYNIKSKFKTGNQINAVAYTSNPIISFHSSDLTIFTANYSIPFIFYKNASNTSKINKLKKIILAVLFNSICNIQYKFTIQSFLNKIKNQETITAAVAASGTPATYDREDNYFTTDKELTINYIDKFTSEFITDNYKINTSNLLVASPSTSADVAISITFIILIFNSYYVSNKDIKKNINANIFNLINNSNDITDANSIIEIIKLITKQEYFLEKNINKDEKNIDEDIYKLYNNNKSIINLIIILFENLFTIIKKEITTNIPTLCYDSTVSLTTIENVLLSYIGTNSTNTPNLAAAGYNTITLNKKINNTSGEAKSNSNINTFIINYFNIVIFLLDNLKLNTNTAEIDAITTNFNFYNQEDIVKSTIQKRLEISCDYYSKYNKLDSKQLSYFKINANNVNYNFPILMIIFLIILGEPIFIKS
jgi:hypothetical protein